MINSFSELYNKFSHDYKEPVILCSLHKPCVAIPNCSEQQNIPVLDFDYIKDLYSKLKKKQTGASVDAISCKENRFVFIEIKGWTLFLCCQKPITEIKIKKQVESYDFENKLLNSMLICCDVAENESLFSDENITYLIITDIDVETHPLENLMLNLLTLTETSSSIESLCNKYMSAIISDEKFEKSLHQVDLFKNVNVKTLYKNCKDFDATMESC